MSGLHLNHHVCWDDLLGFCYIYEDPGITLPICECGRIQASNKQTKHQIKNRKYLDDKICTAPDCKIVGEKIFRKTEKKKVVIRSMYLYYIKSDPNITRFIDKFSMVIKEFADTERRKIGDRNVFQSKGTIQNYCEDIKKRLSEEGKWLKDLGGCEWWSCSCKLFSLLLEDGDSKTLLSFPDEKIKEVLLCQHGGQAVGNNFNFLTHHVMEVYLCTNLIFAYGLQDKPEDWGPMKPGSYFRSFLMYDCDGQTFLFGCRKYLTDEVYMKDFEAMRELCKKCFQFLYILEMLKNEVGYGSKPSEFFSY